jgi:hypothetical protein
MKISDIVNKKKEPNVDINNMENLRKQKEEIEREAIQQMELDKEFERRTQEQMQQPQQGFFTPQGQQSFAQPQQLMQQQNNNPFINVEESHTDPRLNDPRYYQPKPKEINIKFSIFLENGQKLPIALDCPEDKVEMIMEAIDQKIIDGEIITIGDFKIVGSRILYIDLLGR